MPHDILEVENHQLIAEASKTTVATLMLLASSPSRLKNLAVANGAATWTRSPEKGVTGYVVTWGPADAPEKNRLRVTTPTARIPGAERRDGGAGESGERAGVDGVGLGALHCEIGVAQGLSS